MSNIIYSLHTNAKGRGFGWWGAAVHPDHLNPDKETFKGRSFRINVADMPTHDSALIALVAQAIEKLDTGKYGHPNSEGVA